MDKEDLFARLLHDQILRNRHRVQIAAGKLDGLSPLKKLSGGYAYIADAQGKGIDSVTKLVKDEKVTMTFADGRAEAVIQDVTEGVQFG